MFVIKGLRLNKFEYVAMPKRRDLFNKLRNNKYLYQDTSASDNPFGDSAVDVRGLSKVEQFDVGRAALEDSYNASQAEKK